MSEFVEITTTLENEPDAQRLARALVEQRLAACVQITGPIQSVYRWQHAIQQSAEFRCTLKTRSDLKSAVVQWIETHHPYDVPEVLVVDIQDCSEGYAQWLRSELDASSE